MGMSRRTLMASGLALAGLPSVGRAETGEIRVGSLAPELVGLDHWINSPPFRLADLRGKPVLVDFWTFACANCARSVPHLAKWYRDNAGRNVQMIGVHTPEFPFERDPGKVAEAVRRLNITYPVAVDSGYRSWKAFQVRYWPTMVVIDPTGRIAMIQEGEGGYDEMFRILTAMM